MAALLAASPLGAAAVDSVVRGVAPGDKAKYAPSAEGIFSCFDGGASLPFSAVNDDFCDCADGSDEPGTSACSGLGQLFYCPNEHSSPAFIYVSRVNDGICDCCDGSDEWRAATSSRSWPPKCSNTCTEEGASLRRDLAQREADFANGARQRRSMLESARSSRERSIKELHRLRQELPALEQKERDAQAAKEVAQAALDEERRQEEKRKAEAEAASTNGTVAMNASEAQVAPNQSGEAAATLGAEADVPDPGVSEYTKWMEGAEEVLAPKETETEAATPAPEPEPEVTGSSGNDGFIRRAWSPVRDAAHWLWTRTFGEAKSPGTLAMERSQKAYSDAVNAAAQSRRRIEELEKKVSATVDEDLLGYEALEDTCISKKLSEYKYEVCFFKNANQDSVSIGRWQRWEAPGVGIFDDGAWCPGGPARSLRVLFRCGAQEELQDITEPSRCTYQAVVSHPAACTEKGLQALEVTRPRMPTDEL